MKNPSVDAFAWLADLVARHASRLHAEPNLPSLIDLSIGNPDIGPAPEWTARLAAAVREPALHGYGEFRPDIQRALRAAFLRYILRRHPVSSGMPELDADAHVVELLGSKEGIHHLLSTLLARDDVLLLPAPSYTVYRSCAEQLGAAVEYFPCDAQGQPDCTRISARQLRRARALAVCSPNNPTGVALSSATLDALVDFTARHGLALIVDRAYAEIVATGRCVMPQDTALLRPGALEHVVELHSLSKSCGIAGWRIGFALGAPALLAPLRAIKRNADFGGYLPLQQVATSMLDQLENIAAINSARYCSRLDGFAAAMRATGWPMQAPDGGFFLWTTLPACYAGDDLRFVQALVDATGVLVAPGSGFGPGGAGHVRIAMVQPPALLDEAIRRIGAWRTSAGAG